jgi:histidine triad (HIT) family protein
MKIHFFRYTRSLLFRLARMPRMSILVRGVLSLLPFIIPGNRLRETDTLLAFYHPSPSYPVHILLVPKRAYASLLEVPTSDCAFLSDLLESVQILVRRLGLAQGGYRLIANGGNYQEVGVLHFHLVSDFAPAAGEDNQ